VSSAHLSPVSRHDQQANILVSPLSPLPPAPSRPTRNVCSSETTSTSGPTLESSTSRAAATPSASTCPRRRSPKSTTPSSSDRSSRTSSTTRRIGSPTTTTSPSLRTPDAPTRSSSSPECVFSSSISVCGDHRVELTLLFLSSSSSHSAQARRTLAQPAQEPRLPHLRRLRCPPSRLEAHSRAGLLPLRRWLHLQDAWNRGRRSRALSYFLDLLRTAFHRPSREQPLLEFLFPPSRKLD
jgi:hypothetical protein